ncbi:MAG: hypothetical protein ACOYL5_07215 [Phototrophicaceae bacterium]|jgi:hypothetical protein
MFRKLTNQPNIAITIDLDGHDMPTYAPNEAVSGRVSITSDGEVKCKDVEIRLRWYTAGRGNVNSMNEAVDILPVTFISPDSTVSETFRMSLPAMPFSYSGTLIQIIWEVQVEVNIQAALNPFGALDAKASRVFVVRP